MNLDSVMKKLKSLQKGNPLLLKIKEGKTTVRVLPRKEDPENPFQELQFIYLNGQTILSPLSYDERDPIAEFGFALRSKGQMPKEEYNEIKKYLPQPRWFLPVIVRGEESEGVKYWSFPKTIRDALFELAKDEEIGDFTDVKTGTDIVITFASPKTSNSEYGKTSIKEARSSSVLTTDKALMKQWLEEQPDLVSSYTKYSFDELKDILKRSLEPAELPTRNSSSNSSKTNESDNTESDTEDSTTEEVAEGSIEAKFDALFSDTDTDD